MTMSPSRVAVCATFLSVAFPISSAMAQDTGVDAGQTQANESNAQHLRDFVHYTIIAKPELARSHLEQLLNSGITDADLAELVRESVTPDDYQDALRRARYMEGLADVVAELESRVRFGELNLSRNLDRIDEAIQMLGGHLRQQNMAREVLMEAGEYAVPSLLREVTDGTDPTIRQKALEMLEAIGSRAVAPLSIALASLDDQSQVKIAGVLGRIGFSSAAPYLAELAADGGASAAARGAAAQSAKRFGAEAGTVSAHFAALGRRYLLAAPGLTPYPNDAVNNIWSYDAHVGLMPTGVPTAIYGDVMAMLLSRKALQLDPSDSSALSTFIAADLSRENHLPDGETDAIFGESQYSADFYALGAGPDIMQQVLGIAIDGSDTALARDAIRALQKTAGSSNLFGETSDRAALLDALTYPDRRVRYDAALALGKANPAQGFASDYAVVPLLASAVRAADATYALVLADETENARVYSDWLNALGYTVVAEADSYADAAESVARAAGIDLVVVRQGPQGTLDTIQDLRANSKTSVAPIIVLTTATDVASLETQFEEDSRIAVKAATLDEGAFASIVDEALREASGGTMAEAEAMAFSFEAIGTLADIAISNSPVYNINDAESALIDALETKEGAIRLKIAEVLSYIESDAAQVALFDAALSATGPDQIELLGRVADSAKRFGDRAADRHLDRLLDLVQQGGDVGEAAAAVHGALNLPAVNVVQIIAD
jgi:CheY-like chemotaxis protein